MCGGSAGSLALRENRGTSFRTEAEAEHEEDDASWRALTLCVKNSSLQKGAKLELPDARFSRVAPNLQPTSEPGEGSRTAAERVRRSH